MRPRFHLVFAILAPILLLVPLAVTAAPKEADVKPPVIVSINLSADSIDTSNRDAVITATVHITDDLSGVHHMHIRMRPLDIMIDPLAEYQYDIIGECYFADNPVDSVCVASMTVFQYAYEGVWAVQSIVAEDRLRNTRHLYHPQLPGSWNSETGKVTKYYCEMYGYECLPPHLNVTFMNEAQSTEDPSDSPFTLVLPLITK